MSTIDWLVLAISLALTLFWGLRKSGKHKDLHGYLRSGKNLRWYTVGLSIIATQASAITFLSTPGQAYGSGMGFLQLYFGLPIAMILLALIFVPIYHKLNLYTAYEFLEKRFDFKTRLLGAFLFLVQRGLAVGLTIYAPSLILSNILGWNIYATTFLIGFVVILYTVAGGTHGTSRTHKYQMAVILLGMTIAGYMLVQLFPQDVSLNDAVLVAGEMGKMEITDLSFDPSERYNIWSGVIGGFFLALAYFGTDQSQVQRYLSGKSIRQARIALLFNGVIKVPMQFLILFLGALIFVFYQFEKPPLFFNTTASDAAMQSEYREDYRALESDQELVFHSKKRAILRLLDAKDTGDSEGLEQAKNDLSQLQNADDELKSRAREIIGSNTPGINTNDLDLVFITFITTYLPKGLIGLLIAAVIAAAMNSSSSILNALAGTTVVDFYKRIRKKEYSDSHLLFTSRIMTFMWGLFAILFALYANKVGNLIQAVNILGSLFYGTILGIFLSGLFLRRVKSNAVFWAAIIGEGVVVLCFLFTEVSYLWYNVIGCLAVMGTALILTPVLDR